MQGSASDDILNGRVPDMADREDNRGGGCSDSPEVMGETEHRPVVADGTEAGVECVGKFPVVNELCTDCDVGAGLVGRANSLFARCFDIKNSNSRP